MPGGRPSKLTPRQLRFVQLYNRLENATEAAKQAGYSAKTAYSQGQRLLKNVEIAAAIQAAQEDIQAILAAEVLASIRTLVQVRDDGEAPAQVRIMAARDLLDRALGKATERIEQKGNVQVTWSQMVNEARPFLRVVKGQHD